MPEAVTEMKRLLGVSNDQSLVTINVWNDAGMQPRVLQKTIKIDESLFTPARNQELDLIKDACRQLIRNAAGGGVEYDLSVSPEIQKELDEAYKARGLKEKIAKSLAYIIVGTVPRGFKGKKTSVRLSHGMYSKLLENHVGYLQAEGIPKFDIDDEKRVPLELKKLSELRNALRSLAVANKENVYYTLSASLNQTMDLLTPSNEKLPAVKPDVAVQFSREDALKRNPIPPEVREGLAVEQPADNLVAMGNFLDTLDGGLSRQLQTVNTVEKNVDSFMNNSLVKMKATLDSWKVIAASHSQIIKYAGTNLYVSKLFPGLGLDIKDTGFEKLIADLGAEIEAMRQEHEEMQKTVIQMREAMQKASQDMRTQKDALQAIVAERKGLIASLNTLPEGQERQAVLRRIEQNDQSALALENSAQQAVDTLCETLSLTVESSVGVLENTQLKDSFYTARDTIDWKPILINFALYLEWLSGLKGTQTVAKIIGRTSGLSLVPGTGRLGSGALRAARWATYTPQGVADMIRTTRKLLPARSAPAATAAATAAEATGTASDVAQAARPAAAAAEAAEQGISALRGSAEVQRRVQSILETPEFAQVMKARGLKSEQMAEIILRNIDDVDSLIAIEQSQMGRRMLLGAAIGGEAEVARIFSAAKAARVLMTTLNVVGVVGDAFGLAMACVDYQENGKKIQETKNPVLREFYENARPIIIARGAVSGGLLIGGTLVLFAQGAAWMGPVGLVMAAAALGAEGVRQTMNAKEEVLKYYAMDEKDLLSQSTEGQMLEWVGKTDPVMRSRLNWYHSVLPDEQVQDMNINARRNGYRSYFLRTAAETVPHANILDVSQESFIKALSDKSPGTVRSVLEQETKFKVARFVADAVSFVSEQTKGMYTLVSSDVLSKAVLFAKANERLRVSGKPLEPDSSSVAREVFMESLNDRNASAKEIEAMEKVSDNTLDFTRLLLAPLRHDLAVLDQKILTSDLSDDMKASVRGWYAEELWTVLQRLYVDSKQNWKDPRSLDAIQSNLQNILSTQPSSVATKIKKSDQLPVLRGIGQNPSRLSLGGIIDHVNTYRFVKPTHLGLEGRALPLSNLNFYSMTGKGKKAVLKVPQGKDVGWVSSDIPMYQVASYESSPMYNIPQDGHPAYFFLKKGVTYSFWSEDKKTQYVIKAE
jgi:hypothetical protein